MPYLDHLKQNMLMISPNSLVANHIWDKYGAFGHYLHGAEGRLDIHDQV